MHHSISDGATVFTPSRRVVDEVNQINEAHSSIQRELCLFQAMAVPAFAFLEEVKGNFYPKDKAELIKHWKKEVPDPVKIMPFDM